MTNVSRYQEEVDREVRAPYLVDENLLTQHKLSEIGCTLHRISCNLTCSSRSID